MIAQLPPPLSSSSARAVNDVDSSYCSDDDSSSSTSSSVSHVTVLTTSSAINCQEVYGGSHGKSLSGGGKEKENSDERFHGQGCGTSVTRSSLDVDDNCDESLDGKITSNGSDTDGEYDCDVCPVPSDFEEQLCQNKKGSQSTSSHRRPHLTNGSRCQPLSCQTPFPSSNNRNPGSGLQCSPCTVWMSSSSRSLSRLSPCSISGLEIEAMVLQSSVPEDIMYRGEGNSSLVASLTKEGKVIRILKDGKRSFSFEERIKLPDVESKSGRMKNDADENYNSSNISKTGTCIAGQDIITIHGNAPLLVDGLEEKIKNRLIEIIDFNRHVMKRILNHCFLDEPQLVYLDKSQIDIIDRVANVCRPGHRLHKSIPLRETLALLLPDYCSMQQLGARSASVADFSFISQLKSHLIGPVISVEIKPKQGFLPLIESLPSDLTIKANICRFCLKQFYKMKKGNVARISNYCPLDLFSGCIERQHLALKSLIETPQNNFRIFKDLKHVYGDGTCLVMDPSQKISIEERLSGIFKDFIGIDIGDELYSFNDKGTECRSYQNLFCNLLIKSLNHPFVDPQCDPQSEVSQNIVINIDGSTTCHLHLDHGSKSDCLCRPRGHGINSLSILGSVYSAQRLDSVDSYRALEMARYLNERYPNFMAELKSKHRRPAEIGSPGRLNNESLEDFFFRKVWEYIVSLTAKDCSIMITMQRIDKKGSNFDTSLLNRGKCPIRGFEIIEEDLSKEQFLITTSITDLDPKLPATFSDLERKIKEKDYLMVASYNESHSEL